MKVSEVMTRDLVAVDGQVSITYGMKIMLEHGIRRLIVGDIDGIVTIRDLVYGWLQGAKLVEEVMTSDLLMVSKDIDLRQASKIMTGKGVGSLLVTEGERVIGIVTERDLIRNIKVDESVKVGDVMKVDPVVASLETSILEIAKAMRENWERHAIVVENNLPAGVISIRDVANAILTERYNHKSQEIMKSPVFRVTPDSTLETARTIMAKENLGLIPVVDARALLGSVEERDILTIISI
ncbi:CBS domain-containing protein [Metallosphaera cuprina]|uniref:Signal-transduction protein n=1 Tax=Metallosphaera cuprina (strain Ar-4) TaxID=1006006 RepID=F4G1Y2_METCR|nr:CBS domain-containing protein [Metallosphaera cuprina]AEB94871.1 signal-transduction protein [Metallosphaera cuprina Ar-4]